MTRTIDEQLERLASAQERSADALEGILERLQLLKSPDPYEASTDEEDDAGADDEVATEETTVEETEVEEAPDAEEAEPGPEEEAAPDEPPAEEAAEDGDEGDPLGNGDAAADDLYQLPEKMTNDTLRGFARDLLEKEGKPAVFEVLADVGSGYKAVGEVKPADLQDAHEKMLERLRG
ncbi:MAG: hypothetical protein GOVbin4933_35 [Prokaryotic dsDNA virus sp.]|nr:MAG: hypothetical protein GOVbin4933_35 [Prokaryotic dsDNA virus sp.]|tara:strand:+ start:2644 stop:3177 length:534 start_codon:yes stop_codon:yes gene_type:complete